MLLLVHTTQPISFGRIRSFFGATPYEQLVEKDYILNPHGRIVLKNIQGNILVKTGLDKRSVAVKATKRAAAQEHLDHMHIIEEEISPERLILRTTYDYEKVKGSVDYILTVPDDACLELSTDIGNITIQDVQGTIVASAGQGDVLMYNPQQPAEVTVTQQGHITVVRPSNKVQLSTAKGTIRVVDSAGSVDAHAQNGKIEVKCKVLPENNAIKLATQQGPITLHTPKHIQCTVTAETEKGTVSGTQEITLNPVTVQLNDRYWDTVKRSMSGSIGDPKADVHLFSKNGNIQILKY
jgi:hypothetical protein